jgi:hypothetical protein
MFSILEGTNLDDAPLLRAFGRQSSNLADRDHNLVFFASPAQLLIVEDDRGKGMDYTNYYALYSIPQPSRVLRLFPAHTVMTQRTGAYAVKESSLLIPKEVRRT